MPATAHASAHKEFLKRIVAIDISHSLRWIRIALA
jgi:hypothetical protein